MGSNDHALSLNLGFSSNTNISTSRKPLKPTPSPDVDSRPLLTLSLSTDTLPPTHNPFPTSRRAELVASAVVATELFSTNATQSHSGVSSLSNGSVVPTAAVKREREPPVVGTQSEEVDAERNSFRLAGSDEDEELGTHNNVRKKLRLTKEQSALLEESFKQHSTLNPKQKQTLASQLNLRPRQVEVWFQNRRARTKLKQTEADCEFLRKCCETLTDENRRLQKEIQELRALKLAAQPLYMQLPAATLTMCPSCERIGAASASATGAGVVGSGGGSGTKSPFAMAPKSHFFNAFTNPSAAC